MAGVPKGKSLPSSLDRQLVVLYQKLEQVESLDTDEKTLMPKFKIVQPRCNGLCYANSAELAVWLISRGGGWRSRTGSLPISHTGVAIPLLVICNILFLLPLNNSKLLTVDLQTCHYPPTGPRGGRGGEDCPGKVAQSGRGRGGPRAEEHWGRGNW